MRGSRGEGKPEPASWFPQPSGATLDTRPVRISFVSRFTIRLSESTAAPAAPADVRAAAYDVCMDDGDRNREEERRVPTLEELEREVEVTVYQAGGPGGQHRNRTYSAVRLRHIPTGVTVTCADTRSQIRNRRIALQRLQKRLADRARRRRPRVPTRKSRSVRRRELEAKRRRSRIKKLRARPSDND